MKDRSTGNHDVDVAVEALRKSTDQQFRDLEGSFGLVFGAADTGTGTNERFLLPYSPRTAISVTEVKLPMYRAGVLQPFMVEILTIGGAAADRRVEITLRVNGKDSSMRAHFTCAKFTGILRATQSVKVKKDDRISFVIRKSGVLTTACDLGPLFLELK